MKKRFILTFLFLVLTVSFTFGRSARIASLGLSEYIADPSNVFANPAKLSEYSNTLYGEATGINRVFASIALTDDINIGVLYPASIAHSDIYTNASTAVTSGKAITTTPNANALHLACSFGPIGAEVFTEYSNNINEAKPASGSTVDNTEGIRSYDVKIGFSSEIADAYTSFGIVKSKAYLNSTDPDEDVTKGTGLDISAGASSLLGSDTKFGGFFNFNFNSYSSIATVVTTDTKLPAYSNMNITLGALSEIELYYDTKLYTSVGIEYDRKYFETRSGASTNTKRTFLILPALNAGIEHKLGKVWKFDEMFFRVGASRSNTSPVKTATEIGNAVNTLRGNATATAVAWTTGLGIVKGNFSFDAVVNPATLNGANIISGAAGPVLTQMTMTYKLKSSGSSSSSNGSTF